MRDTYLGIGTLNDEIEAVRADADIVDAALAASGDAHAYERLYRTHVARIHSLARRMISPDAADDANTIAQKVART